QPRTTGAKDDVLEAIPLTSLGEEMAGEVPPFDGRVVRSIVTRQFNRDWGVRNGCSTRSGGARGDDERHQDPDREHGRRGSRLGASGRDHASVLSSSKPNERQFALSLITDRPASEASVARTWRRWRLRIEGVVTRLERRPGRW